MIEESQEAGFQKSPPRRFSAPVVQNYFCNDHAGHADNVDDADDGNNGEDGEGVDFLGENGDDVDGGDDGWGGDDVNLNDDDENDSDGDEVGFLVMMVIVNILALVSYRGHLYFD